METQCVDSEVEGGPSPGEPVVPSHGQDRKFPLIKLHATSDQDLPAASP